MQQDSLASVTAVVPDDGSSTADASAVQPVHKLTVAEVQGWLPRDASESQRDSIVQKYFPNRTMTWEEGAEPYLPLGRPALAEPDFKLNLKGYKSPALNDLPVAIPSVPYRPQGIAGDPLPYQFRTDDFVTITLLLSFFLGAIIVTRSWHFLSNAFSNFFFEVRERANMFSEHSERELHGQGFLVFQTCLLLGILFLSYVQLRLPEVFAQVSPYIILLLSVGICASYYAIKILLFRFVNYVFFEAGSAKLWTETYLLYIFTMGFCLFPLILVYVFFDLNIHTLTFFVLLFFILGKTLLFYKCYRIFFNFRWGFVYLISYFCALEVVPLLALWRTLVYAHLCLITDF